MGRTVNFFFPQGHGILGILHLARPTKTYISIAEKSCTFLTMSSLPSINLNLLSKKMLSEAEEMVCSHPVSQIFFSIHALSGKPAPVLAVKAAMEKEIKRSLCSGWLSQAFGMAAGGRCESTISGASTSVCHLRPVFRLPGPRDVWVLWCILEIEWYFGREHGLGSQVIHCPWWGWGSALVSTSAAHPLLHLLGDWIFLHLCCPQASLRSCSNTLVFET